MQSEPRSGFIAKIKTIKRPTISIPKRPLCIAALAVILLPLFGYAIWCAVPKAVEFSYDGKTCTDGLVIFPDKQATSSTTVLNVSHDRTTLGGLFATRTCFEPVKPPEEGFIQLASAPFGWPVFRTNYMVHIGSVPKVLGSKTTAPIALSKPVVFSIDKPDTVYSYKIKAEEKTQSCSVSDKQLSCRINELNLTQGTEHTVSLIRTFKDRPPVKITDEKISVLPAVTVTGSSVAPGQTVYEKPTTFAITTNKPIRSAKASLEQINGTERTKLTVQTAVKDATITVSTQGDLEREKQYVLTLVSAEGTDESMLSESYRIDFATSGGPKVTGINIAANGVDPNARIVVSFDQALDPSMDIAQLVGISGVNAAISRQGGQVIFALQNAPRCTPFSLKITKGIKSAANGLTFKTDWSYNSRINCRTTSVIGYSVKGRPIVAYYYGSGSTTSLFTGGMHGNEWSGQQTMQAWANYLDTHAPEIPVGKQVVIVPNTNPDGIAAGSRLNARGVNIDRNFATADWKSDIQVAGGGTLVGGGGSAPMSEPETQALANLTRQLNPRIEVSYHAQGRLVGANDYADSRTIASLYASTVGYSTMFGGSAEEIMGYSFSGQYEDYIAQKLGRPAILIELPSASGNYLSSQLPALWKIVNL